ncbi:MAG TPA: LLM class flavin-dependent oxidoreductase [Streptosporangiaceae bacterium]|jgi:F420-dependent oxidoreductase-like protein
MALRIGISAGTPADPAQVDYVREAERLGVDSVWSAEAWGHDALTPLAYYAAVTERVRLVTGIAQLGARTPANLAMSAMAMQAMSHGRFVLGLGTSGPQVMEGWHGVRFDRPVTRTRETIDILRMATAGEKVAYDGDVYTLPLPDGEGVPIRSRLPAVRIPIYLAALGPRNLRLTGAAADGWIGNSFFPETADVFLDQIRAGAAEAGRTLADLDVTVAVSVEFTEDAEEAGRRHADGYAFTFGAMGSAKTNFYNDAFVRQGYGEDVRAVQALWRAGDRTAAARRVPTAIGLGTNLIGTDDMVAGRLRQYRDAGVTTLRVGPAGATHAERLDTIGRLMDLVRAV